MNRSEKVGKLGRGLQRDEVSSHGRENLQEDNDLPDDFFHNQKRDMCRRHKCNNWTQV